MAETGPAAKASQLPPPPQPNAGAPGYENGQGGQNGQSNPAHMPPPPLHIPQNTNPIPTAITSPMSGVEKVMSPSSAGGFARRAAPEPNKRALYVGGLDQRVTEDVLRQIFETTGHVQNVKIIPDKNVCWQCGTFMPLREGLHLVSGARTLESACKLLRGLLAEVSELALTCS